jgi:hypothetical protein
MPWLLSVFRATEVSYKASCRLAGVDIGLLKTTYLKTVF